VCPCIRADLDARLRIRTDDVKLFVESGGVVIPVTGLLIEVDLGLREVDLRRVSGLGPVNVLHEILPKQVAILTIYGDHVPHSLGVVTLDYTTLAIEAARFGDSMD